MPTSFNRNCQSLPNQVHATRAKLRKRRRRIGQDLSDTSDEDYVMDQDEYDDDDEDEDVLPSDEFNGSGDEEELRSTSSDEKDSLYFLNKKKISRTSKPTAKARKARRIRSKSENPKNQTRKCVKLLSSDDEDYDYEPGLSSDSGWSSTTEDDEYDIDKNFVLRRSLQCYNKSKKKKYSQRKITKPKEKHSTAKTITRRTLKAGPLITNFTKKRRTSVFLRPVKQRERDQRERDLSYPEDEFAGNRSAQVDAASKKEIKHRFKKKINSTDNNSDPDYVCSESEEDISISGESSSESDGHEFKSPLQLANCTYLKEVEKFKKKGKEKAEATQDSLERESSRPTCGICLSDDGKASRGKLDSCLHYFCFACIMEWAKVESKCPMCKQRFNTITKSSRCLTSGKGLRGTIVKVPVRNQVYQPSEEEVIGILDPYANVACVVCNESRDDDLLLLCDLCDSAHHTYCVGLGRTVPDGDWYCHACQRSVPNDPNIREDGVDNFVLDFRNANEGSYSELAVGTSQAQEGMDFDLNLPPPLVDPALEGLVPVRIIRRRAFQRNASSSSQRMIDASRTPMRSVEVVQSLSLVSNATARTLSGQRRLQEHVHALHGGWTAPGRSSQSFYPNPLVTSGSRIDRTLHLAQYSPEMAMVSNMRTAGTEAKMDSDQSQTRMEHTGITRGNNFSASSQPRRKNRQHN